MDRSASDKAVFDGCRKGDKDSFRHLFTRHGGWLMGVCLRYCNNKMDAEDVLQEALVKVFSGIGKFEWVNEAMFRAWLKRIVVNAALNHIREMSKATFISIEDNLSLSSDDDDAGESPGENLNPEELLLHIQALPEGYRVVFNLYVFEKFSHKEIAEQLGISENTSKTQLLKARRLLKKRVFEKLNNYAVV